MIAIRFRRLILKERIHESDFHSQNICRALRFRCSPLWESSPPFAATSALAQSSAAQDAGEIRKLNSEGKPGSEKDVIMPVIVHNGLIYVSGQGAHDTRDSKEWTIESHTTMVMDKIKKHVEIGGGTMDSVLQANVLPGKD